MKNLFRFTILFGIMLALSACGSGSNGGAASDSDIVAVIEALESAWNSKDIEAAMALYADDAVSTNGAGMFTGKDEIRTLYEQYIDDFSQDCRDFKVDGNTVTYECFLQAYAGSNTSLEYYETVIENGKIKSEIMTGANRNP